MTEPHQALKGSSRDDSLKEEEKGKRRREEEEEERSDSEEESEAGGDTKGSAMDNLTRLKREKRLEMNRRSARERRKRKKVLIETLEQQVSELTKSNEKFKRENQHLVLRVESLSEALAKQEKELTLLRSIAVGKGHDPQFMAHQLSSASSMAATPRMMGISGLPPGLGADAASDVSLRHILHSERLKAAAMGNHQSLAPFVPTNRAIDQEILSRIGRDSSAHGMYDPLLPSHPMRPGLGAMLPGQNTVSGTKCLG